LNTRTVALLSIVLILLPLIPAYLLNFLAFVISSAIGFIIVIYIMISNKTWTDTKNKVVGTYFSGVFATGVVLGEFLELYSATREFAIAGLVFVLPFIVQFILLAKDILPKLVNKDLIYFSNGYLPMLIVIIIGALVGRMLTSFYSLIILYSGTIVVALLVFLYFRK